MIKAVLDACVLYPAPLRDVLLSIASVGCFHPIWSEQVQDEWKRNLLAKRGDLTEGQLEKTVVAMDTNFKESNVTEFESLIEGLELPDPDDRHVLALAIKSESKYIVTANLKDFPQEKLDGHSITATSPDDFIDFLYNKQKFNVLIIDALAKQRGRLKKPSLNVDEFISILDNQSLKKLVQSLQSEKCNL